jgi:hypothetical protein
MSDCKHEELDHCPNCDTIRCKKCGRLWGNLQQTIPYIPQPAPYIPNPFPPVYPWGPFYYHVAPYTGDPPAYWQPTTTCGVN